MRNWDAKLKGLTLGSLVVQVHWEKIKQTLGAIATRLEAIASSNNKATSMSLKLSSN